MELIKSDFPLKGVVESRIGGRGENQDFYGSRQTAVGTAVVVCDGMGGMRGGQIASNMAVELILAMIESAPEDADVCDVLKQAIKHANSEIFRTGRENQELFGMGTTVTALIISQECATVAYVGDSRVYQLRGGRKHFRTFDHSMVFEMVKSGVLTEEQARLSDQSNVILKALGVFEDVEPDIYQLPYVKGDRFVLCSDGFWGCMPEPQFVKMLGAKKGLGGLIEEAANRVEELGRASGGNYDNLTAAVVDVMCNSKMKEKMNKTAKIIIAVLGVLLAVSLALNICMLSGNKGESQESKSEAPAQTEVTKTEQESNLTPESSTETTETSTEVSES